MNLQRKTRRALPAEKKLHMNALPGKETGQAQHRNSPKTDGRCDNRTAPVSVRLIYVFLGNRTEVGPRYVIHNVRRISGVENDSLAGDSPSVVKGQSNLFSELRHAVPESEVRDEQNNT